MSWLQEISSVKIEQIYEQGIQDGNPVYVEKGDHLGYFQYGGSSGIILLTKEVVEMKKQKPFWNFYKGSVKMGQPILKL